MQDKLLTLDMSKHPFCCHQPAARIQVLQHPICRDCSHTDDSTCSRMESTVLQEDALTQLADSRSSSLTCLGMLHC